MQRTRNDNQHKQTKKFVTFRWKNNTTAMLRVRNYIAVNAYKAEIFTATN